jgi:hypothetical protein
MYDMAVVKQRGKSPQIFKTGKAGADTDDGITAARATWRCIALPRLSRRNLDPDRGQRRSWPTPSVASTVVSTRSLEAVIPQNLTFQVSVTCLMERSVPDKSPRKLAGTETSKSWTTSLDLRIWLSRMGLFARLAQLLQLSSVSCNSFITLLDDG